jgi:fatty acid amide hydrolase 2
MFQVPLGVNSKNVPIGIQVLAAPHQDALCLEVAKYLEKEFGGAIMACRIK